MEKTRWLVAPEHDLAVRQRLMAALGRCGFEVKNASYGIAGSQEVSQSSATSSAGSLEVEAETYMGLTVEGPSHLVELAKVEFQSTHG